MTPYKAWDLDGRWYWVGLNEEDRYLGALIKGRTVRIWPNPFFSHSEVIHLPGGKAEVEAYWTDERIVAAFMKRRLTT